MIQTLPQHLAERTRGDKLRRESGGRHVLYWMRYALRGHENPALDVACTLANAHEVPLLVVQVVHGEHRFASDRLHRFVLEGARDVAAELAACGITYACHVARRGEQGTVLSTLATDAVVVVTEDMPTPDARAEVAAAADATATPFLFVDTACTLPMACAGGPPERAFRFRKRTAAARDERIAQAWPEVAVPARADLSDLPFPPVDFATVDLDALIADCDIDHAVGPVADTMGGSRAGYARWADFRDHRLKRYARERNDATRRHAVSRLSPYLHYGMVAPLRIAREARERDDDGADKFLDELLVWREMAHVWAWHADGIESLGALPEWAQETLEAHRDDVRETTYDWETLARGRTGDDLWDAAQTSLLVHGELHNNLRMTWGKMLVPWSPAPETALAHLVDLNHRYALDGRDPNSYGGLLWCLGLFDRPFPPADPVVGTLRQRSTESHARRLDVARYRRNVERPNVGEPPRVAVVGAGIAGLACARTLADHRFPVVLFDKSRGLGGRLATRRTDAGAFDHGAPYLTATDARFRRHVDAWTERGLVRPWLAERSEGAPSRSVAVPGMSRLGRELGAELDRRQPCRIARLEPDGRGWRLVDEEGGVHDRFDAVVVATPAPQAIPLLEAVPAVAERVARARMAPCWTGLFAFAQPLDLPDMVRPGDGPLAIVLRNSAKPGRGEEECWVVHGRADWTRDHLEADPGAITPELYRALAEVVGEELPVTLYERAHRWRYAHVESAVGETCLFDAERWIAACGDWCLGPTVEDAFLSGVAAAGRLLNAAVTRDRAAVQVSLEESVVTS